MRLQPFPPRHSEHYSSSTSNEDQQPSCCAAGLPENNSGSSSTEKSDALLINTQKDKSHQRLDIDVSGQVTQNNSQLGTRSDQPVEVESKSGEVLTTVNVFDYIVPGLDDERSTRPSVPSETANPFTYQDYNDAWTTTVSQGMAPPSFSVYIIVYCTKMLISTHPRIALLVKPRWLRKRAQNLQGLLLSSHGDLKQLMVYPSMPHYPLTPYPSNIAIWIQLSVLF